MKSLLQIFLYGDIRKETSSHNRVLAKTGVKKTGVLESWVRSERMDACAQNRQN